MRPKDSKVQEKEQDTPTSPKSTEVDLPEEEIVDIVFETGGVQEKASAEIEAVDEADEDMAEILDKSILGSMISALEAMGEKEKQKPVTEAGAVGEEEEAGVDISSDRGDLKEERPIDLERLLSQEKPAAPSSISIEDSLSPASGNESYSGSTLEEKSMLENGRKDIEGISRAVGSDEERHLDSTDVGPAEEKPLLQEEPEPDLVSFEDLMAKTNEEELHHEPVAEETPAPKNAVLEERLELIRDEIRALKSSTLSTMVGRIGKPFVLFGILVVFLAIQIAPFVPFGGERAQKPGLKKIVEIFSPRKRDAAPETSTETPSAAKQGIQLSTASPSSPAPLVKREIVRAPVPKRQETIPKKSTVPVATAKQEVRPLASESSTVPAEKETVETAPPKKPDTTSKTSAKTVVATKQEETHGDDAKVQTVHTQTVTSHPYSVYLGSYGSLERAEKAIMKYKEDGLSSLYWQEVDLGEKGVWYRIFTGHFENREEGEEFVKEKRLTGAEVKRMEGIEPKSSKPPSPVIQPSDGASKAGTEAKAVFTSFPYSVYLGSYKTLDRARKVAVNSPSVSYWVSVDLGEKGIWYRVYTGYFRTRDEAGTFIEEHQIADGESRRTPYANLIGTYRSDEESDQMNRSLLELGFCPYVIKEADGRSRLFTGAFYQRERAEKEHRDLAADGIQSQLVKR